MARCKKLLDENEQLSKMISSDNVTKLEGEISLQNKLLSNMKDSQKGKVYYLILKSILYSSRL
jgi:hypothetical protein